MWKSVKHTIVATSTMEAEFLACYGAVSQALRIKSFMSGLKIKILCDNTAAVFFAKNNKSGSKSRHIDTEFMMVRNNVERKNVCIEHIRTMQMVADPFTKALPVKVYEDHVKVMGLVSSF